MKIKTSLPFQMSSWMLTSRNPVYLYSRVELRRNLADNPLPDRAKPGQKERIIQDIFWTVDEIMQKMGSACHLFILSDLSPQEVQLLKKKGLISPAEVTPWEALILDGSEEIALEINRSDHITLRITKPGFQVQECVKTASLLDALVAKRLSIAYHKRFGYLTSSVAEVGTGMRIILCGTFPGLVLIEGMEESIQQFRGSKIILKKVDQYAQGHLFLLNNRTTLGVSEVEIEEMMYTSGKELEEQEVTARKNLYQKEQIRFEDRVWRAVGLLTSARMLSFREALYNIALVRSGYRTIPQWEEIVHPEVSAELFYGIDPEFLALFHGLEPVENEEIQVVRANWVRNTLSSRSTGKVSG
ncbi:MAG: hypothetical protein V2G33_07415 [bacterium JZ-2024 1]